MIDHQAISALGVQLGQLAVGGLVLLAAGELASRCFSRATAKRAIWQASLLGLALLFVGGMTGFAGALADRLADWLAPTPILSATMEPNLEPTIGSQSQPSPSLATDPTIGVRSVEAPMIGAGEPVPEVAYILPSPEFPLATMEPAQIAPFAAGKPAAASESVQPLETALEPVSAGLPSAQGKWIWTQGVALLGVCWLVGSGLLAVRFLLAVRAVHQLRRRAAPVHEPAVRNMVASIADRLRLRWKVALLAIEELPSPIAFGVLHPTIGLPARFHDEFGEADRRVMLTHELAHLAQRDLAWGLLAELVRIAWWWQPAVWWCANRLRSSSEWAADEASTLFDGGPSTLANCLVTIGRQLVDTPIAPARFALAFQSDLGKRVQRLLHLRPRTYLRPRWWWLGLATGLWSLLIVAVFLCPTWSQASSTTGTLPKGATEMVSLGSHWRRSLLGVALTSMGAWSAQADDVPVAIAVDPVAQTDPYTGGTIVASDRSAEEAAPAADPLANTPNSYRLMVPGSTDPTAAAPLKVKVEGVVDSNVDPALAQKLEAIDQLLREIRAQLQRQIPPVPTEGSLQFTPANQYRVVQPMPGNVAPPSPSRVGAASSGDSLVVPSTKAAPAGRAWPATKQPVPSPPTASRMPHPESANRVPAGAMMGIEGMSPEMGMMPGGMGSTGGGMAMMGGPPQPKKLRVIRIPEAYRHDPAGLVAVLRQLLGVPAQRRGDRNVMVPSNAPKFAVDERTNSLMVNGTAAQIEEVNALIGLLSAKNNEFPSRRGLVRIIWLKSGLGPNIVQYVDALDIGIEVQSLEGGSKLFAIGSPEEHERLKQLIDALEATPPTPDRPLDQGLGGLGGAGGVGGSNPGAAPLYGVGGGTIQDNVTAPVAEPVIVTPTPVGVTPTPVDAAPLPGNPAPGDVDQDGRADFLFPQATPKIQSAPGDPTAPRVRR